MSAIAPGAGHQPLLARLRQRALSLGAANALEAALQFLLPVVLARALDAATFGEYRLLWLVVGTVMAVGLFGMTNGLYYFLPRSEAPQRRLYIYQTLFFLGAIGLVVAWAVSPWNPWLPEAMQPLARYGALVPAFIALWVVASLLDIVPSAEERIGWQVGASVSMSLLRAAALAAGAWLTGSLGVLIAILLVLVVVKLGVLAAYIRRFHGRSGPVFEREAFSGQVRHSVPFGLSSSLYGLRGQVDQWVAASLFALQSFAAFSVAAVLAPLVTLFRTSVNYAFLPNMSKLQASNDVRGMLELNTRANVLVAAFVCPVLAIAFAFAPELIAVVYTRAYVEGAPVMRLYIAGMLAGLVEVGSLLFLLKLGGFAFRMNAMALALSIALSWWGAHAFGLAGAALGSVAAIWVDRVLTFIRVAKTTGIPVREQQDWRSLAMLLGSAAVAAALSAAFVNAQLGAHGDFARLAVGGTLAAILYLLFVAPKLVAAGVLAPARAT